MPPKTCDRPVYSHSFDLPAWMPRHQVQRIKRSGLSVILHHLRYDGFQPDWSSLDIRIDWSNPDTEKPTEIHTTIAALKGGTR